MRRATFSIWMISAIACFTAAVPVAHAGGGMGEASDGVTTCRLILNGAPNQSQAVTVTDPYVSGDEMKVGAAVLVCDLAALAHTINNTPPTGSSVPTDQRNSATCYTVTGADQARFTETIVNPFANAPDATGTQDIQLGPIQLFCVPSNIAP